MPASRRRGKRMPPDRSVGTDQQRQGPHINASSGESSGFYMKTFNVLSRSSDRYVTDCARQLAERALAAKLTINQCTNKASEGKDERHVRTISNDIWENAASWAFPRLSLLRIARTHKPGAPQFSRRGDRRSGPWCVGWCGDVGVGESGRGPGAAVTGAHRRPSPFSTASSFGSDGRKSRQWSGTQMDRRVVFRGHGEGWRHEGGIVLDAAWLVVW